MQRVVEFYTSDYDERGRFDKPHYRLELVRTKELLAARLPEPPARVLDVGGGPGTYAAWLAQAGYDVELIDLVPHHVAQALEHAEHADRPFTARVGDACALDVPDESVDACLLLGPLYHLPTAVDRAAALAEAVRVTRSGGIVAAAAISRYAWPLDELRSGVLDDDRVQRMTTMLTTGVHDPESGFTISYMHRPGALVDELETAGLRDVDLVGVEGPGWLLFGRELTDEQARELLPAAMSAARLCDGDRDMAAVSAHLLAVGVRP